MVNLNKCKYGDKLLTRYGKIVTYYKKCDIVETYKHLVYVSDNRIGSRTDDGFVYMGFSSDDDIVLTSSVDDVLDEKEWLK